MTVSDLLNNLANGLYDGERTDSEINGVTSGLYIHKGTPVKYREGKGSKHFDNKENVRMPGRRTEERYDTDEKKIEFFQKFGFIWEMFGNHPEVIEYSRQYYENKKRM